ncbi:MULTISPECIES: N-acetyl-D-Glu racemase DgcA [Rhodomicrobium]|uniref:N-acetyl-D-Glu racemase DgcA n=1 Tax=Rhodomicrobium TaxID=1068 RepID=UPI000B4A7E7A|nr:MULTISPECIES: N-acetyl-D-Glu racemase DgcA [Rhodomicrobium]
MVGPLTVTARIESWPIAGGFTIARGAKREAVVVVAEIGDGRVTGRGECVPYARYGESAEASLAQIEAARFTDRLSLAEALPPGAARNALDCALWDFEAKSRGVTAFALAGRNEPGPVLTAYTISLATPEIMAAKSKEAARFPLLKLKLGGEGDAERLRAIRAARPDARLIADANEAWRPEMAAALLAVCAEIGVELVEQPLPAGNDTILAEIDRPVPVCADESVHTGGDLAALAGRYDAVNIKLDKTGGLTEALAMADRARALGLKIMVGCMVSTSLAMAPALVLAQGADWVDLDGPLLLERDREPGLAFDGPLILPAPPALWG